MSDDIVIIKNYVKVMLFPLKALPLKSDYKDGQIVMAESILNFIESYEGRLLNKMSNDLEKR
jgi:hypothetical protein